MIFKRNYFKQNQIENQIKQQAQITYPRLVLMWGLILLGYFLFVLQWYSISNFSSGYNATFFSSNHPSVLEGSATNWSVTLGRSIGSILAGYFIAKFGHKYAVIIALSLMLLSFPYLIVAQNTSWNALALRNNPYTTTFENNSTAVGGFSLFVIFRIFLGIGGTTLIVYTNNVIVKMPVEKRSSHITLNSFGFNLGAFFANIFFVNQFARAFVADPRIWVSILSVMLIIVFAILVLYLFFGLEVLAKKPKTFSEVNAASGGFSFKDAFKKKNLYSLYVFYGIWSVTVIFTYQFGFRAFVAQSPINTEIYANYLLANPDASTKTVSSIFIIPQFSYVYPLFISLFAIAYVISALIVNWISKTIFSRKFFIGLVYFLGLFFMGLSLLSGYFGGFNNSFTTTLFFFFGFVSGIFLWSVYPLVLQIPQQEKESGPKYVSIVFGLLWGANYFLYTVSDAFLSSLFTYVNTPSDMSYSDYVTKLVDTARTNGMSTINQSSINSSFLHNAGSYLMMALFWVLTLGVMIAIKFFPTSGFKNKNNNFVPYNKIFNPFKLETFKELKTKYLIKNYL